MNAKDKITIANRNTFTGGSFQGNTVTDTKVDGKSLVDNKQLVNPDVTKKMDDYYEMPWQTVLPEVLQSYFWGVNAQKSGVSAGDANISRKEKDAAHDAASKIAPQSGNIYNILYDSNGKATSKQSEAVRKEWFFLKREKILRID